MKYLCVDKDGNIGFKIEGIHEIVGTDVFISDEVYDKYFMEQSEGRYYQIRDINGETFDEIFEEKILEKVEPQPTQQDLLQEQIDTLALQMLEMLGV